MLRYRVLFVLMIALPFLLAFTTLSGRPPSFAGCVEQVQTAIDRLR